MNIEEGKSLNYFIHLEEEIILLPKSLKDQGKEKTDLYSLGSKPGVLYGLAKTHKTLEDRIFDHLQDQP